MRRVMLFNYLLASVALEIGLKVPVYEKGIVQIAPCVALGSPSRAAPKRVRASRRT